MLELRQLEKSFPSVQVLQGLSLKLPERGIVAFMGPSGSGKTTLFMLIARLLPADGGTIKAPAKCSFVFQEDRLLPWSSVGENIALVLEKPRQQVGIVHSLLTGLGLKGVEKKSISGLSGGMRRRVAIGRALAYDAPLLLLDEPFQGLDLVTKGRVMDIIAGEGRKKLVLLNTHDPAEAAALADRVYLLDGPPLVINKKIVIPESYQSRQQSPSLCARYRQELSNLAKG